jgi:phenylacetate-CoA ligase
MSPRTSPLPEIWPLKHSLRGRRFDAEPEEVASRQAEGLRRVVAYAWANVPYYRRLFDRGGISPRDIRSIDDLSRIPLTSKRDLRICPPNDVLSSRAKRSGLLVFQTSGSTGIPITIHESRTESLVFNLIKFRTLRALGLNWRDKMIKVQNRGYVHRPLSWRVLQRFGLLRQEDIHSDSPHQVASVLAGKTADILTGYTGNLARVAQILADRPDLKLKPRFVVGGSDTLTPFFRRQIQTTFRAPLRDTYICREAGMIAWECPVSGRYHVEDDHLIVEVLKDGIPARPGEQGEVVVTSLVRRTMPFIRYRLDDFAMIAGGECPCGRRSVRFDRVLGKTQDYFWLPGGVEFNPWPISGLWMSRAPWILQLELVQEEEGLIILRIVPSSPPPQPEAAALIDETRKIFGPGIDFRLELVEDIKPDAGGKFRVHRSLVRSIHDDPRSAMFATKTEA